MTRTASSSLQGSSFPSSSTKHDTTRNNVSPVLASIRISKKMDDKRRVCARAMRLLGLGAPTSSAVPSPDRVLNMSPFLQPTSLSKQQDSALFSRLPLEIRLLVYSFVLPESKQVWVRVTPPFPSPARASYTGDAVCIEHFPVRSPPTDLTWTAETTGACCAAPSRGFFGRAQAHKMRPHEDALAMMKTCQRMYLELCQLTSFCFDSMDALSEFASVTAALPIRHVQVVLHTSHLLYCPPARHLIASEEHDGWMLKLNVSWERYLQAVDAVCREMPGLTSVLLSVHPEPRFARLVNEEAVVASLRAFTAAPRVVAEVFGGKGRVVLRGAEMEH
ncbi:hypothetical protein QBC39DRAFT_148259 [Podospora conica]|nr:hypothetical protein QBC39DRAFT_148259 [Schizothecium conicum]